MEKQDIYRLPNQEIEKSIIYEIPRSQKTTFNRYVEPVSNANQKKYRMREEIQRPSGTHE
jgi:hypothetical protein